jgi:hypothetical protein
LRFLAKSAILFPSALDAFSIWHQWLVPFFMAVEPFIIYIHTSPEDTIHVCRASSCSSASQQIKGFERLGRTILAAESHFSPIFIVRMAYPALDQIRSGIKIEETEYNLWERCFPSKSLKDEADRILAENSIAITQNPSILNQLAMPRLLKEAQDFLMSLQKKQ